MQSDTYSELSAVEADKLAADAFQRHGDSNRRYFGIQRQRLKHSKHLIVNVQNTKKLLHRRASERFEGVFHHWKDGLLIAVGRHKSFLN